MAVLRDPLLEVPQLRVAEAGDGGRAELTRMHAEHGARVAPWLFGIARNVSLEMRKARFRTQRVLPVSSDDVPEVAAPGSPESDLLGKEALGVVERALARMNEERRAMLLLRLDHALAYEEIAELMGCSLAKVKVEIFRAREILRATMAEYERGERR